MNENVKAYFDALALRWDDFGNTNGEYVRKLISFLDIAENSIVLDLACGTGVLTPYLLQTSAKSIVGLDISPKMIEVAKTKYDDPRVLFQSGDFYDLNGAYTHIICYNAYPHFLDREGFAKKAFEVLSENGILIVAHDSGRLALDKHHDAHAKGVSRHLLPVEEEVDVFKPFFDTLLVHDDEGSYYFVLRKHSL